MSWSWGLKAGVGKALWLLVLVGALGVPLRGQTLAHKGWAGSGMTVDPWWKNAVFYELDPLSFQDSNGDGFGDLNGVTSRLDYLQGLGVDAIVLSPFQLQPAGAGKAPFEAVYGSEEDFDRLQQEAIRRKIRLVVDVPLSRSRSTEETLAMARFWLSRGVSGLRLMVEQNNGAPATLDSADRSERVRLLRRLCAGFAGDRVLISEAGSWVASDVQNEPVRRRGSAPGRAVKVVRAASVEDSAQLAVDRGLTLVKVWSRFALQSTLFGTAAGAAGAVAESDTAESRSADRFADGVDPAKALAVEKMVATVLFAGREEPMLYFGQEVGMASEGGSPAPMQWGGEPGFTGGVPWIAMGPNAATANVAMEDGDADSLLNWYRKLSQLRHDEASLHAGSIAMVETGYPDVVAWVRRGANAKDQPVLVVCNVSGQARVISVAESLHRLGLSTASGVHAVALSIAGMDPSYAAQGIMLPAYGVYVGEVRQPGLEDSAVPVVRGAGRKK